MNYVVEIADRYGYIVYSTVVEEPAWRGIFVEHVPVFSTTLETITPETYIPLNGQL